jgi:hypothetical protein
LGWDETKDPFLVLPGEANFLISHIKSSVGYLKKPAGVFWRKVKIFLSFWGKPSKKLLKAGGRRGGGGFLSQLTIGYKAPFGGLLQLASWGAGWLGG